MATISGGMRLRLLLGVLAGSGWLAAVSWGAEKGIEGPAAGRLVTETASLLRRPTPTASWQIVKAREELPAEELLLFIGRDAALESNNRAVRVSGMVEMTGISSFPILETAVILHESKDVDLDLTLDRGRIVLTNEKKEGPARVRFHIRDRVGQLVLTEPKAQLAMEIYGRWLPGVPFRKEMKDNEGPTLAIVSVALKGKVLIQARRGDFTLQAPPGPALLMLSDLSSPDVHEQYLEKLPPWADGQETPQAKKLRALTARLRKLAASESVSAAVGHLLESDDAYARRLGVYALAALDDLPRLGEVLANARHQDSWDAAVLALRHWIGRAPGQDQKLYQGLINKKGFSPAEAEVVLSLLHSFGEEDLQRPELYEMLIEYLRSPRLAIRGLANWHLRRLVPEGRKLGYDPLAAKPEREKAIAAWKKLIPGDKMPPNHPK